MALRVYNTGKPKSIDFEADSSRTSRADNQTSGRANSGMTQPTLFYPIASADGKCQAIVQATKKPAKGDFTATEETTIATMFERWCSNMVLFKINHYVTSLATAANFIRSDFIMNRLKIRYIKNPLVRPADPRKNEYPGIAR